MTAHRLAERVLLLALGIFIVADMLPASFAVIGWVTAVIMLLGMLVPSVVERTWHRMAHQVHWIPLTLGTLGLALHAFLDGAALAAPFDHDRVNLLPAAIIAHRFFEGVFIWWALRPRFGWEVAAAVLGLSSSFTVAGYMASAYYFPQIHSDIALAVFQAIVAGSLLHLTLDRHDEGQHPHHSGHKHQAHRSQRSNHSHRAEQFQHTHNHSSKLPRHHGAEVRK